MTSTDEERLVVPTRRLGDSEIPAVVLGDHGFMRKFGSHLDDETVAQQMAEVLTRTNFGIAAGSGRLLRLADQARDRADRDAVVVHHTDIALRNRTGPLRYRRCGATLRAAFESRGMDVVADGVFSYLAGFSTEDRLSLEELDRLRVDRSGLEALEDRLSRHRPAFVTIGGDWLDMLLVAPAAGPALHALDETIQLVRSHGAAPLVTLYVGPMLDDCVLERGDGLMVPLGSKGTAMLPDQRSAERCLIRVDRPLVGMHVLDSGRTEPLVALQHASATALDVTALVIGASQPRTIEMLIRAARAHFEERS